MKEIIVLLCLGLVGCVTISEDNQALRKTTNEQKVVVKTTASVLSVDQKEIDNMIVIFNQAIQDNPSYAPAYYNRAYAYFYASNYDKSWEDIHRAEALGIYADPKFRGLINKLKKASGREK